MTHFANQGHAEDVLLWHRYNYYVLHRALIADAEYDVLESAVRARWPVCLCGIGGSIGSDDVRDYPGYVQAGARPLAHERILRDEAIRDRWMNNL